MKPDEQGPDRDYNRIKRLFERMPMRIGWLYYGYGTDLLNSEEKIELAAWHGLTLQEFKELWDSIVLPRELCKEFYESEADMLLSGLFGITSNPNLS